jgi:alcohol dehydrogenase
MVGLVRTGLLNVDEVEVTRFALDEINAAIDHAAANGGPFKRTVVAP